MKVALLGFGNVGRAFARYVGELSRDEKVDLHICAVADSSGGLIIDSADRIDQLAAGKEAGRRLKDIDPGSIIISAREFINRLPQLGVSAVVESLPTNLEDGQPALDLITAALGHGINVVTVDKGPPAHAFDLLTESARAGRAQFRFSGTTGVSTQW